MNQEEVLEIIEEAARDGRTKLRLTGKSLTSVPAEIGQLKNLTRLDLDNNKLMSLPAEMSQLKNLKELYLPYNKLTSLPGEIGQLQGLIVLELIGNDLTSVPAEIGQLKKLRVLTLGGNKLTSLPVEIWQLKNLTILVLDDNNLTSLPSEIGQLKMLERLYLHGNDGLGIPPEVLGRKWTESGEPARPADIIEYYFRQQREARRLVDDDYDVQGFDVFLCHNSQDKAAVKEIGQELERRGVRVWLDDWELRPGLPWQQALEEQLENIKSAAVFAGDSGIGPWQKMEMNVLLREFVKRGWPVIPVILKDCKKKPKLPVFLRGMTWVDLRRGSSKDGLDNLVWGITGKKPGGGP